MFIRRFQIFCFLIFTLSSLAVHAVQSVQSAQLMQAVTATGAGIAFKPLGVAKTFVAYGNVSAAAGAATIKVQGSLDNVNWVDLDTLSLTLGTAVTTDFYVDKDAWKYVRGNCTAISGTDASINLLMGVDVK